MTEFRADMHCHSIHSDGTLTPRELLLLAKEKELSGLSITDHDGVGAYTSDTHDFAKEQGISLCMGVEFSCRFEETNIHILGYNIQPTEKLHAFCNLHRERRSKRNAKILKNLEAIDVHISEEELHLPGDPEDRVIGRPHIAKALKDKGVIDSIQEAFDKYLGEGKPHYDRGEPFTLQETLDVIHSSGGKAFIAHPQLIRNHSVFNALLTHQFEGIECYYSRMPRHRSRRWLNVAKERNLLTSGGSDFHGAIKPQIELGASWTNKEAFDAIMGA